jgi:SAM-dependent methyltransferase
MSTITTSSSPSRFDQLVAMGAVGTELRSPFALPRGPIGRLAGRLMAKGDAQHVEVARLVAATNPGCVLEVGFGPGQLIAHLLQLGSGVHVGGVEPSELMIDVACRRNRAAVEAGHVDLRIGAAAAIPWPNEHFDVVVSVNTVAMWPDLDAATAEMGRVLCPGGELIVAWHSATSPRRVSRRLALDQATLDGIARSIERSVGPVRRRTTDHSELFTAVRR